jgi:hypothetical protein
MSALQAGKLGDAERLCKAVLGAEPKPSLEDYEALTLRLARNPALLGTMKQKLLRNRDTCPLFDTARFTRHIEADYEAMWRAHEDGHAPAAFAVEVCSW